MQIRRFAKIPLPFLMVLVLSSCAGILSSCGPNTVHSLIPTLQKFAGFTIQLAKRGRTTVSITANGEKLALKIEQEIIKDGLKLNASLPLASYQEVATAMYMVLHNGKRPPMPFDESKGTFIIVVHNGERTAFLSEQNIVCVANVAEAQLVRISQDRRTLTINATQEVTDVMFAVDEDGCKDIEGEITKRKVQAKANQDAEKRAAIAALSTPGSNNTGSAITLPQINPQRCEGPKYPLISNLKNQKGTVVLSLLVNSVGDVIEATVKSSSGFAALDMAALQAGRECSFSPALQNGQPVTKRTELAFNFDLTQ
ncbi:MAG: Ferric siderophore transport system [Pseudomonadota bacterium]|jgi:TonB family protein